MHLGQRDGERESGAEHRVCEPVRRNVGSGAERRPIGVQDGAFGHHPNLFLEFAASRRAVDAAAARENGVAAAPPIDGVARRGSEQREQPVGLQVNGGSRNGRGGLGRPSAQLELQYLVIAPGEGAPAYGSGTAIKALGRGEAPGYVAVTAASPATVPE